MTRSFSYAALVVTLLWASAAVGQNYPAGQMPTPAAPAEPAPTTPPPPAPDGAMTLQVRIKHGADSRPIGNTPVFLRAARPRGPFEPTAPAPQFEWTGFADATGTAMFTGVPRDLATSGLRVHAVTTFDGLAFESAAAAPLDGTTLEVVVWDKSLDTSGIAIANLRSVVEVWENYLVFTQYYTLTNKGSAAIDVKLLPGAEYEKGLPIVLPVKAQGINVMGPGESQVIESTVHWKGVLEPGARANLQVRFSMSAKTPEFTYEQTMGWPTDNVEIVVPIQTRFQKVPRLGDVELRPPGFAETDRGAGIFDLRDDVDFVGARGLSLESGQSFSFQLRGLPFVRPKLPWVFLGFGVLAGVLVLLLARREFAARDRSNREDLRVLLEAQRAALLDDLVSVERDLDEGRITRAEAEVESAALREQLALILKKLQDLEAGTTK